MTRRKLGPKDQAEQGKKRGKHRWKWIPEYHEYHEPNSLPSLLALESCIGSRARAWVEMPHPSLSTPSLSGLGLGPSGRAAQRHSAGLSEAEAAPGLRPHSRGTPNCLAPSHPAPFRDAGWLLGAWVFTETCVLHPTRPKWRHQRGARPSFIASLIPSRPCANCDQRGTPHHHNDPSV